MDNICFICRENLDGGQTVTVTSGIDRLISVSNQREDGHEQFLKDLQSLIVHRACRKKYIDTSNGKLKYPNLTPKRTHPLAANFSPHSHKIRKKCTFEFADHCFICTKEIKREFVNKKLRVSYNVSKPSFQENFTKVLNRVNSTEANSVRRRIMLSDLIANGAKYHSDCYSSFLKQATRGPVGQKSRGRPLDCGVDEKMELVFDYIHNNADCQFTLKELSEISCG